jgi:glycosyltransferase involved in cell wall biosynthesis
MRIAFDHQIFGSQEYGGVSRYAYELSAELARRFGSDVGVIAPLYVNRYLDNASMDLNVMGVSVRTLPKTARLYRALNSLLAWPALRYFHPDIVHETYYSPKRLSPGYAKVVLTVYDMIHEKFGDEFPKGNTTSKCKALAVNRADHIICISKQTRLDLIEQLDVDPAKTSVIHLGFTQTNQAASEQKVDLRGRPFFLYVGARGGYKNFDLLARVYADSTALRNNFDLVCFGGGAFASREKSMLQQLGLSEPRVRHVSGDDSILASLYRSASVFIYPSLYEGFGIPPLEAMNFDCPVVCSDASSIPEVVGDAAELFDPSDPDSMRTAVERVASDEALRGTLVARGRDRIKQFSWERCAKETLDVYARVLSSKR